MRLINSYIEIGQDPVSIQCLGGLATFFLLNVEKVSLSLLRYW